MFLTAGSLQLCGFSLQEVGETRDGAKGIGGRRDSGIGGEESRSERGYWRRGCGRVVGSAAAASGEFWPGRGGVEADRAGGRPAAKPGRRGRAAPAYCDG